MTNHEIELKRMRPPHTPFFSFTHPFWLGLWACVLSVGWLIPTQQFPWGAVYRDIWIAVLSSAASLAIIWRFRQRMEWHRITLLAALLVCVPGLQAMMGQVPITGVTWISSAYLLGLLLALLTGAHWERFKPSQLADGLFLAIGIAATISVGMQLQQWLGLDHGIAKGGLARPHATLGQPNQLATLLLWGILAAAWGCIRAYMRPSVAILMALFLLLGVALTASRTAWIGVTLLIIASWWWRRLWPNPSVPWIVMGLGLCFALFNIFVGWLPSVLQLSFVAQEVLSGGSANQRLAAWTVLANAAWLNPWLGYGWNQTAVAQMATTNAHPAVTAVFSYAHNLFLDLIIWCGIPVGLFVAGCLLRWFWLRLRAVENAENAVLVLFLLVVANHAMLELPLYYAYFLLPVGLVMGMLNVRLGAPVVLSVGPWFSRAVWLVAAALLVLVIRDYRRIEPSYKSLIISARIPGLKLASSGPPDVLLLTQWRDYIEFARWRPHAGASAAEVDRMRNITELFPSAMSIFQFADTLALNQQPDEARIWLQRLCKVTPVDQCEKARTLWAQQSLRYPEIAAIAWPISAAD
jgi:O-antigen ligase